jgi:actin-like ATPase involved in cell morphogenesis
VIGFPSIRVGLDTGTANTLVYVKGRGVTLNEPTLVTIRISSGNIEAVGGESQAGRGRTPRKFQTARPIRTGMISDLKLFEGMLRRFLRKACQPVPATPQGRLPFPAASQRWSVLQYSNLFTTLEPRIYCS